MKTIIFTEEILKFSYRPPHLLRPLSSKHYLPPGDFRAIRSSRYPSLKMTQTPLILLARL